MNGVECMNGLNVRKSYSQWVNDATFFDYYQRLKMLAISEFEWSGLPATCDQRFLELILFEFGYVLFFQHDLNKAFLTLQCALQGPLNMYRIPIYRRAYAVTGFNQLCSDQNSVIIWNNYLRQPTSLTIELFAGRLTEIERAINVNIKAQKTPVLIKGSIEQQKTLKKVYDKYDGNSPVIFGDKDLDLSGFSVLKTDAPESYLNLMQAKTRIWNEALTFLGINNTNTDKRERLITDEVNSNLEELMMDRENMLVARQQACDIINDLFANQLEEEISVRFREPRGGAVSERLYNGSSESVRNSGRIESSRESTTSE